MSWIITRHSMYLVDVDTSETGYPKHYGYNADTPAIRWSSYMENSKTFDTKQSAKDFNEANKLGGHVIPV
jgi:glutathionylspermidine synthase